MSKFTEYLEKFFFVFLRGRTYLNMLYLLLSFPLGIIYFVVFITGFSVGIPLIIVWVGLLVLLGLFALWYFFVVFERKQAIWLLKENIAPINNMDFKGKNLWNKFTASIKNPVMWKGLVFLIIKFPLGIINFSVLVTALSLGLSMLTAPLYYRLFQPHIDLTWTTTPMHYVFVDTLPEALFVALIGFLVLLVSLHLFNGMAYLNGIFARVMLGNKGALPNPADVADPIQPEQTDLPAN